MALDWRHGTLVGAARTVRRRLEHAPAQIVWAGVGSAALAVSSDLANTFDTPWHGGPFIATALALTLAAAFGCFLLATRSARARAVRRPTRMPPRLARLLIYPVLLWSLWTAFQTAGILAGGLTTALTVAPPRYGSDDLYYNHFNAVLVLRGENPYAGPWLVDEVTYFHDRAYTPIARGRFADPHHYPTRAEMDAIVGEYLTHPAVSPPELDPRTTHSYPAGAFLVDVPAIWAGAPSVAVTQIALLLGLLVALVVAAPGPWRPVVLLLALTAADGARQVTGSDFEIWPLALLAGAWLLRGRRWPSALLLGAACAIKQTAWIAAPFYLIWVWRERGGAEAARRAALAGGAFVALNLPWIVATPRAWLASLLLPVSLPLLPDGSGVIGLALAGVMPLAPHWLYAALEVLALVGALVWYWRFGQRCYPFAGFVLPLVPLFFAWRSSERYFVLLPLAAAVALALTLRDAAEEHTWPAPADAASASTGAGQAGALRAEI